MDSKKLLARVAGRRNVAWAAQSLVAAAYPEIAAVVDGDIVRDPLAWEEWWHAQGRIEALAEVMTILESEPAEPAAGDLPAGPWALGDRVHMPNLRPGWVGTVVERLPEKCLSVWWDGMAEPCAAHETSLRRAPSTYPYAYPPPAGTSR